MTLEKKKFIRRLMILPLLPAASLVYVIVNLINDQRDKNIFNIVKYPLDDVIKFNRIFAIPYFYWYFLIAITALLLIRSKKDLYYRYILCSVTGMLLSCAIFIIFPTYVPRPFIEGNDILTKMVQLIYTIDKPYNCFPSAHVVYAVIISLFLYKYKHDSVWFNIWNMISCLSIIASTVFMKQHYLPDVVSGAIIGVLLFAIYEGTIVRRVAGAIKYLIQGDKIENE